MLGWYIPGLSELPLGNRLPLLLAGPSQRFFIFSISPGTFGSFFLFFFVRFVCVRVVGARHRGRARRRRGYQRLLAGRGGVARSAVAVFVARRCVCLETRGKHEWALSSLHLWVIEYVRVYMGRSGLQDSIQAVLLFATKLKFTERATQCGHQHCRAGE